MVFRCRVHELLSGKHPIEFPQRSLRYDDIEKAIISRKIVISNKTGSAKELITNLLNREDRVRPSSKEAVELLDLIPRVDYRVMEKCILNDHYFDFWLEKNNCYVSIKKDDNPNEGFTIEAVFEVNGIKKKCKGTYRNNGVTKEDGYLIDSQNTRYDFFIFEESGVRSPFVEIRKQKEIEPLVKGYLRYGSSSSLSLRQYFRYITLDKVTSKGL